MFVKGAKFPKGGPNFLGNMAPGEAIFPRKFGPGGPYFGGAKFPGTPEINLQQIRIHISYNVSLAHICTTGDSVIIICDGIWEWLIDILCFPHAL